MLYRPPPPSTGMSPASLSSMIDIIFLLIIFFVVTASFDREQIDSEVSLPVVDSAAVNALPPDRVMLNILRDGSVKIGFHQVTAPEIENRLSGLMRTLRATPETTMVINADRETPYRHLQPILEAAAEAGFTEVRINAEVKETEP